MSANNKSRSLVYVSSALSPNGQKKISIYCDIDTEKFYTISDDGVSNEITSHTVVATASVAPISPGLTPDKWISITQGTYSYYVPAYVV